MNGALAFLKSFMTEMKEWESNFCDAQDEADEGGADLEEVKSNYKRQLFDLLTKYSLAEGLNRERLVDLGATIPTTYDPNRDSISADGQSGLVFLVKQTVGFKSTFRFLLLEQQEGWVIKRKDRLDLHGDWVASSL